MKDYANNQPRIDLAKTRRQRVIALCAEWSRGCTNTVHGEPWDCPDCTLAFARAIEAQFGWKGFWCWRVKRWLSMTKAALCLLLFTGCTIGRLDSERLRVIPLSEVHRMDDKGFPVNLFQRKD